MVVVEKERFSFLLVFDPLSSPGRGLEWIGKEPIKGDHLRCDDLSHLASSFLGNTNSFPLPHCMQDIPTVLHSTKLLQVCSFGHTALPPRIPKHGFRLSSHGSLHEILQQSKLSL